MVDLDNGTSFKPWKNNSLWKNIYIDIEDGKLNARYSIRNDYDSICDEIDGTVYSMMNNILNIEGIGSVKINNILFQSYNNHIILKATLLQVAG